MRKARTAPLRLTAHLLLAVVLGLLTLQAIRAPHLHKGSTAGLYNEEHVLASLESTTGDVPLPGQVSALSIALVVRRDAPAPAGWISSEPARRTDPRAPPLA